METITEERKRTTYLGGTDCAGILGMSRWKTPLQVWAEKTGQIVPEDLSHELPIKMGKRLEEVVVELFCEETGKKARRVNETLFHPEHDFLGANIDRRIVGEDAILEAKTASGWKAKEWEGEDIPQEYILQCQHYLAVTGAMRAYIAVLIGGNQAFKWKVIERDEEALRLIVDHEVSFWRHFVEPRVMPGDIMAGDSDTLGKLFPTTTGETITFPEDTVRTLRELQDIKEKIKSLEKNQETFENQVKALLGYAVEGIAGDFRVTWANQKSRRLDTIRIKKEAPEVYEKFAKETETRVLRIVEKKDKK